MSRNVRRPAPTAPSLQPRLRVLHGEEIALGPGKVALLEAIASEGSIAGAARALDMSYSRAWLLVRTMNACFREPLVVAERGGGGHGRAVVTATGRAAMALYRRMLRESLRATGGSWRELRKLLAP